MYGHGLRFVDADDSSSDGSDDQGLRSTPGTDTSSQSFRNLSQESGDQQEGGDFQELFRQLSSSSSSQPIIQYTDQRHYESSQVNVTDGIYVNRPSNITLKIGEPIMQTPENMTPEQAIEELKKAQALNREDDLLMRGIDVSANDIPVVHPRIMKITLYEGEHSDEAYQPALKRAKNDLQIIKEIPYEDILRPTEYQSRYIGLIGFPGAGKSTCSKRLAKTEHFVAFRFKFSDSNYKNGLTLQQLLIDYAYPDLTKDIWDNAFNWVKHNQEKVLIIMDGLDQAEWSFETSFPKHNYNVRQHISNIIASLCNKHFLPRARLIMTSRPNALLKIDHDLRPDVTYLIQELSLEDAKTLINALAKDPAAHLWNTLTTRAPQLVNLCQCPLMLVLYVQAALHRPTDSSEITTMTRIFAAILENLRHSRHTRKHDIATIMTQLSQLAFNATKNRTVVITAQQLEEAGLNIQTAQVFVDFLLDCKSISSKFFDKDTKASFWHQSFQEYFAALHIARNMTLEEFKCFLGVLFTDEWLFVRRFVCGLVLDPQESDDTTEAKQTLLIEELSKEMKRAAELLAELNFADTRCPNRQRPLIEICLDLREANNREVTEKVAQNFPSKVWMMRFNFTSSEAHALSYVMRWTTKRIEMLYLFGCLLDSETFAHFVDGIRNLNTSVGNLTIRNNSLSDVEQICFILHKIGNDLKMQGCFADEQEGEFRDADENEKRKLQEAVNSITATSVTIEVKNNVYIKKQRPSCST